MKILYVSVGFPYPPASGAQIRDFHLIKYLSKEHEVFLLSLTEDIVESADISKMKLYCSGIDCFQKPSGSFWRKAAGLYELLLNGQPLGTYGFFYKEMAEKLKNIISEMQPDIVQLEHSFLAPYVKFIPDGIKKVMTFHNFGERQYLRIFQMSTGLRKKTEFFLKWLTMRKWECKYAEKFDACITVSEEEEQILRSRNEKLRISVIDNGVDAAGKHFFEDPSIQNTLLFVGVMGYPPNADGVEYFCRQILPLIEKEIPDIQVCIAGTNPSAKILKLGKKNNIRILGFVEDLLPYYQKAGAVIIPLRAGGGTRLKILEAMAYGRPIVSTSLGCEGLKVKDDQHILIADTPVTFARRVVQILTDPDLREKIARNARDLVLCHYDWPKIGQKLSGLYWDLMGPKGDCLKQESLLHDMELDESFRGKDA